MKKMLIASGLSIPIIILFGLVIPLSYLTQNHKGVRFDLILIFGSLLVIAIGIVCGTTLLMIKYADRIDKLGKEEEKIFEKSNKLDALIIHYNKLILQNKNKNTEI